jgi:uncharacterized repeat protein (TIGR01451 family)
MSIHRSAFRFLTWLLACGFLAGVPAVAAAADFNAVMLPGNGAAAKTRVAVDWHGTTGAKVTVTLRKPHQGEVVLLADHALAAGVNLLTLPVAPTSDGSLHFSTRDPAGSGTTESDHALGRLRDDANFGWESHFARPDLQNNAIAATVWDDGNGPALYVGGLFLTAGKREVNRIARWDGSEWSSLAGPSGVGMNGQVFALASYNGDLIAAGAFTEAGGESANYIARWDGLEWSPLGSGAAGTVPTIYGLAVHDGALIAVGSFTGMGDVAAHGVASWDGSAWSALGTGIDSGTVFAVAEFGGDLVVGGNFLVIDGITARGVARWDGSSWSTLGSGVSGGTSFPAVQALALYDGQLVAGGIFAQAGGVAASNIARWDGSTWTALDTGTSDEVYALHPFNGGLLAAGEFDQAGALAVNHIANWDGSAWSALSGAGGVGVDDQVRALADFQGEVVAAGVFTSAAGVPVNHVARWDGTDWGPLSSDPDLGLDNQSYALATYQDSIVAAGTFTHAGSLTVNSVARWDGLAWNALTGPSGTGISGGFKIINSMVPWNDDLVVGGSFSTAGGYPAANIARWDGTDWAPLNGVGGASLSDRVWAVTVFQGQLVAAGNFTKADGITVNRIARYDGSNWIPLTGASGTGVDGTVYALSEYDGDLIVAGNFSHAGGLAANHVARWDGSEWSALAGSSGDGVNQRVQALAVYDGALVVGGAFTQAGGLPANWIARWDGSEWSAFGTDLSGGCCAPYVRALSVYNDDLFVGGIFEDAGGEPVNYVARWDGSAWSGLSGPAGTGVSGSAAGTAGSVVWAFQPFDADGAGPVPEKLFVGGNFSTTGGVANWGVGVYGPVDLALSPNPLDFGSVVIGESRGPTEVTLTNHAARPLTVDALPDPAAPFARVGGSCAVAPFTLASGDSCTVSYTFTPVTVGASTVTVEIGSDAMSGSHAITLQGVGTAASLDITPSPLDFGEVITGETGGPSSVTLTNADIVGITVGDISAPAAPFARAGGTCAPVPFTLAPSASCTLIYTFAPTTGGGFSSDVVVTSDAGSSPNTVTLLGSALLRDLALTPDALDFGAVPLATTSAPMSVVLENSGVLGVTVDNIAAPAAPFALSGGTCGTTPFTLAVGESCSLDFTFSPAAPGLSTTTVTIESNAVSTPGVLSLQGVGSGPAIDVDPVSFDVTVGEGHTLVRTLTVANPGNEALDWQVTENPGTAGLLLRPLRSVTVPPPAPGAVADGAAGFFIPAPGVATPSSISRFDAPAGATSITESDSFDIQAGNSAACQPPNFGQPPFPTARESFYRAFTLGDFGINGQFDVSAVSFGIETLNTTADLTVNLYTLDGPMSVASLTLIGSATQSFTAQTLQVVTVPVAATVPPGATLVVEIAAPAMTGHQLFVPGSNNLGQTGPSYVNSFGQCSVSDITDYADLGQPDIHLVMSVTGTPVSCALPSWVSVSPPGGTVAGGDSEDAQVTFDPAGLPTGTVEANVCVASNDPFRPLTLVPVSMTVVVLDTFTVTPGVIGGHGSISPDTPQSVDDGYAATFDLTPDAGYHVDTIGGTCGGSLDGNQFTTDPVSADCSVEAHFALDPPAAIDAIGGTPQTTTIGTAFADPLAVRVTNAGGVGLPGLTVIFVATSSDGATAILPPSAVTDANGEASVTATANSVAGSYMVQASVAGVAASADFSLANTAGTPQDLLAIQGGGQSAPTGTPFAVPLAVQVLDAGNNPLAGIEVHFAAPATGAGATLSATSASTDASGIASVTATANDVAGSYAVDASVDGIADAVQFGLTNTAPVVDLSVSIDDGTDAARYGEILDYVIVVHNAGSDGAHDVDVLATLPPEVDPAFASWICLDAQSGACSASGTGALADSDVTVAANGSVGYLMSAPVRLDAAGADLTTSITASSPDDPSGASADDTDSLVVFRGGFDDYGEFSAPDWSALREPFGGGDTLALTVPATPGSRTVDVLLAARAPLAGGFRVERLSGPGESVRLVATDPGGRERATAWSTVTPGMALALSLDADAARVRLAGVHVAVSLVLDATAGDTHPATAYGVILPAHD